MGELNGKPMPEGVETPNQQAATVAQQTRDQIDALFSPIIGVLLRGILVSSPGVPPAEAMNSICRVMGNLMAGSIQGDLQSVLMVRKGFKDAFADGVQSAKLIQNPGAAPFQPGG